MLRKASLFLYALVMAAVVAWKVIEIEASTHSSGKVVSIELTRGKFDLLEFPSKTPVTRAIILFGSGDGGWSGFEEMVSQRLQDHGYEVIGINSNAYAQTDYDLGTLQADFDRIAQKAEERYGDRPPPVILAGWSMGAAQAIAAGGGPHPPKNVVGLLLLDPCSRGRYGLRITDLCDFLPTGAGTFSADEFARTMGSLRVAQWHAGEDSIDSRQWLVSLTAPHKEFDFEDAGHYYTNHREDFLRRLVKSIPWILSPEQNAVTTTGKR